MIAARSGDKFDFEFRISLIPYLRFFRSEMSVPRFEITGFGMTRRLLRSLASLLAGDKTKRSKEGSIRIAGIEVS